MYVASLGRTAHPEGQDDRLADILGLGAETPHQVYPSGTGI